MQKTHFLGIALMSCVTIACGGSEGFNPTPPAGTFNGQPWSMVAATVQKASNKYDISLFSETVAKCSSFAPSGSTKGSLLWTMPAELGNRPLKLDLFSLFDPSNQTVTFLTPPSSNTIATTGAVEVLSMTDTMVTIGVLAKTGTGNDINGTFTATLCP